MNRLVLIGNGFDLAHGLKTSYADFINWYWKQRFSSLIRELTNVSDDGLCKMTILKNGPWSIFHYNFQNVIKGVRGIEMYTSLKENENEYKIESSSFFEQINKDIETKGWVDIERVYYSYLVLLHGFVKDNYLNYNNQFAILRRKLIDYISLENQKNTALIEDIRRKIYRPIEKREIAIANIKGLYLDDLKVIYPEDVMLLNFNYTKTPELYWNKHQNININYIHGYIDNPCSIIFGYGDELDKDFIKLKEQDDQECLHYVKSINYLESDNYRRMLTFIESGPFQIIIMGHSCGHSDRTLLNTLFEHKNCVSIKPYYYKKSEQEDNYLELVQNISRNFTDMKLMRDRVVNKTYCEPLT